MKKYSDYKVSKFKWIESVPSHWSESRISYLFEIGRGRVISELELNPDGKYPVYSSQTKNNGCMGFIDTYDFDDTLLTWTTDGANAGTVFLRSGKFNCTNVCGTLKAKQNVNLKFFLYYLQNITPFYKRPDTNGAKIMNNEMAGIYCAIPPIDEQNQMANYLDHHTSTIDNLIQQKEKLIELLKQKRQSLIFESLTKGIDSKVKLKESGVEWIGNIPSHWKVKKLKHLFKVTKNIAGKLGYDVLSVTQKGIRVRDIDNFKGQLSMDYSKYQLVEIGDFIMNHMDLLTGYIDISKYFGVTSPDYRVFRNIDRNLNNKFYLYLFQYCYHNKIFYGQGQGVSQLGRWRMSTESFNEFLVPVTSREEQDYILDYIETRIVNIDSLIEQNGIVIEKLIEYRQSIISEVVTGKIDVRDWQPQTKQVA